MRSVAIGSTAVDRLERKAGKRRRKPRDRSVPYPITNTRSGGGKKSKRKGSSFENVIAKLFEAYFGGKVRRTPGSGGWGTVGDFGPKGDLVFSVRKAPYHIECFTGNTLVLTAEGYVPIKDVKVGDRVSTHAPHSSSAFKRVAAVMKRKSLAWEMKLPSGSSVWTTPDHPFESFDGWQHAKDTTATGHITKTQTLEETWLHCAPHMEHTGGRERLPVKVKLDEDMCRLLGLYIAEGHVHAGRVVWTFHQKETNLHWFVKNTVEAVFGLRAVLRQAKETKAFTVSVSSRQLCDSMLMWCGTGSRKKRLGKFVHLDTNRSKSLLRGLFEGDGCVKADFARYTTVSRVLANDVQMALLRLQIASTVSSSWRGVYSVIVSSESLTRLGALLNVSCASPVSHPGYVRNLVWEPARRRLWRRGACFTGKVREEIVYNLTVEGDETYVIEGGTVVHNCKKHEGWDLADLITGIRGLATTSTNSVEKWWKQTTRDCPRRRVPMLVFSRNGLVPLLMLRTTDLQKLHALGLRKQDVDIGNDTLITQLRLSDDSGEGERVILTLADLFKFIRPPRCSPRRKQWARGIG